MASSYRRRLRAPSNYVSDYEQFLRGYLARHPEVRADQRRGMYRLWDRRVDAPLDNGASHDGVPLDPYRFD